MKIIHRCKPCRRGALALGLAGKKFYRTCQGMVEQQAALTQMLRLVDTADVFDEMLKTQPGTIQEWEEKMNWYHNELKGRGVPCLRGRRCYSQIWVGRTLLFVARRSTGIRTLQTEGASIQRFSELFPDVSDWVRRCIALCSIYIVECISTCTSHPYFTYPCICIHHTRMFKHDILLLSNDAIQHCLTQARATLRGKHHR